MCIVGNKTDLESQRKVSKEEAHTYADSIGATYFEASALHDQGNTLKHMLFRDFVDICLY